MLKDTIKLHFKISFVFFVFALFCGFLYSLNLLGVGSNLHNPADILSLHVSLMLYGFAPLMLSMLPFALFDKDKLQDIKGNFYLNLYFIIWYIFLIFMIIAIAFGNRRGLIFYDFPYELNFLLAFSGVFYLIAILKFIRHYKVKPFWVKVSLLVVAISPFLLILLMNPTYGQVEKMINGPHGDNTLGMSFALLVLYYLTIKLHSKVSFKLRYNWLWIVPLFGYIFSVLHRVLFGNLTYNQEWFFQWLTLLYIPMLYIWFKDAKLKIKDNLFLFISIVAFIFADIEGNILFIPQIRAIFHRNDLVVGHAHIAVGIGFLFLAFAVVKNYFKIDKKYIFIWAFLITSIGVVLTISGFSQANILPMLTYKMWILRSIFGAIFIFFVLKYYLCTIYIKEISKLKIYHLIGFFSDGIGGIVLLFFAPFLYNILDINYQMGYQDVVFAFMIAVGFMHLLGLKKDLETPMAYATVISRIMASAIFFALFNNDSLDFIAIIVSLYDLFYALIYLVFLYEI